MPRNFTTKFALEFTHKTALRIYRSVETQSAYDYPLPTPLTKSDLSLNRINEKKKHNY
jgi:hypothetical protein